MILTCRMPRTLPFVNMWDNHEFSWQGWQSIQNSTEIAARTNPQSCRQSDLFRVPAFANGEAELAIV